MTAIQRILASDLSPATKAAAVQFEAGLQWFGAAIDCFTEGRHFSPLKEAA